MTWFCSTHPDYRRLRIDDDLGATASILALSQLRARKNKPMAALVRCFIALLAGSPWRTLTPSVEVNSHARIEIAEQLCFTSRLGCFANRSVQNDFA